MNKGIDFLIRDIDPRLHSKFKQECAKRSISMRAAMIQLMSSFTKRGKG